MRERASRVARTIQHALGDLLARGAVKDPRVSGPGMVSITDVTVGDDLGHARVFVSIFSDESDKAEVLRGLEQAAGYLRQRLTAVMRSKRIPRLSFHLDDSMERGSRIDSLLKDIEEERNK